VDDSGDDGAGMQTARLDAQGFALIVVLVVLAVLYAGAAGIFVAARAELYAGSNVARAEQAFHAAEGGIASWLADPVQPATDSFHIGGVPVRVDVVPLLTVDSITSLYLIVGRAALGGSTGPPSQETAAREIVLLGRRTGAGRIEAIPGTWRERFR
jgi:hypothetical protein